MILINLLPHREAARKRRKEAFQVTMFLAVVVGLLVAALVYWWFQSRIENQQDRNAYLSSQIAVLDKQIKEIAGLEGEINALRERQKAVEALQANRNLPVHLLNELVRQLPEGVYISSIKQNGLQVEMRGVAQSNERVSEVLRNLSGNTAWFAKPDLKEIVASTVALSPKDQRKVVNFNLSFLLVLPVDAESGAAAVATGGAKP
ncbi:PilN domain-containing protein [Comamonas aquatica]|uniref:Fimbrial assembly protein (PilN) n=1 Tax=Comamonas aquatica TaxID=225991 RepID=A0AA35DAK9_9BURK|nr:PilN domain-containing protein [Comamonas aquatica]MDH0494519.1 PilN domain-containing protein [Comamonas aquatica]CAB5694457.1 Fimbrial assembly protein (PilN) [Comamonas aquatica]CAB5708237.1 Fimbrial assembly protein (PilN) [Comamonas aquatica]CAC9177905.1 Fimbrial assembly protein (PilN) [Comamonas aquatica]CAC9679185.1 Fimbrial assembly protein (PilN) [Comamonas aquatica]